MTENIAKLARIDFSKSLPNPSWCHTKQLEPGDLLLFEEQLKALDSFGELPEETINATNVWREDKVKPSLPIEVVMKNAPDKLEGFFRVPGIIEDKDD